MGYASGFTIWRREDVWTRRKSALMRGTSPSAQPIKPFPTGRNLFLVATRHFVPGYLHLVPSGQQTVSTPTLRVAGFEDEDSLSDVAFRAHCLAICLPAKSEVRSAL